MLHPCSFAVSSLRRAGQSLGSFFTTTRKPISPGCIQRWEERLENPCAERLISQRIG